MFEPLALRFITFLKSLGVDEKKVAIKIEIRRLCDKWHNEFDQRAEYNGNYDEYLGVKLSEFIANLAPVNEGRE